MSIKDQIRAEIERRITDNTFGAKLELIDILAFLDTLPEQPVDGLEEAAKEYATKWHKRPDGSEWKSIYPAGTTRDFIAGAEWMKANMLKDDPVILPVEDFQALIDSHAKRVEADYKEKMMKDAVEIEVKEDAGGYPIVPLDAIELYDYENEKPLAKAGDKVRVIVVKEDEK